MACFGFDSSCAVELISLLGQALGWLVLVPRPRSRLQLLPTLIELLHMRHQNLNLLGCRSSLRWWNLLHFHHDLRGAPHVLQAHTFVPPAVMCFEMHRTASLLLQSVFSISRSSTSKTSVPAGAPGRLGVSPYARLPESKTAVSHRPPSVRHPRSIQESPG